MDNGLFNCLDESTLYELWPSYKSDILKIDCLTSTNIRAANIALNSILKDDEKTQLEELFFAKEGWYKKINQSGMMQLKFAAMSLGLTNNVLTYDPTVEKQMLEMAGFLTKEQQLLNARCYLKQKAVTYFTMKKYLVKVKKCQDMTIRLYRGIKAVL